MGERQGAETLRRCRARVRPLAVHLLTETYTHTRTHRYYEWLKKGSQRIPHFTRHKDQRLMLFAGLYDSVTFEGAWVTCCVPVTCYF